jgi:hypothetical protein
MAGTTNSWFAQYANQEAPCINDVQNSSSISSCLLWLVVGLVIGSLSFEKKKTS